MKFIRTVLYPTVIAAAVLMIALAFVLPANAQPVCVSAECDDYRNPGQSNPPNRHKRDDRWVVPVTVIVAATAAVIAWILNHEKKLAAPDPEPAKAAEPQERILTITPDVRVYQ